MVTAPRAPSGLLRERWARGLPAAGTCLSPPTSNPHAAQHEAHVSGHRPLVSWEPRGSPAAPATQQEPHSQLRPAEGSGFAFIPVNTVDTQAIRTRGCMREVPDRVDVVRVWSHAACTARGQPASGHLPAGRRASPTGCPRQGGPRSPSPGSRTRPPAPLTRTARRRYGM